MLSTLKGISPHSEEISDASTERARGDRALIMQAPARPPPRSADEAGAPAGESGAADKLGGRGRKTFAFWTLVCLLFVLAIGNLVLTFTILGVLRLGQGMESMEFLPEHNVVKLFGRTDLDHVYKRDGLLESFSDTPLSIVSENGSVVFNLQTRQERPEAKLVMNSSGISFLGLSSFSVRHPVTGEDVFTTAFPDFPVPSGVRQLNVKMATTKRITAPIDSNLNLRSETSAHLRGAEGTHLDSKELLWSADQDIFIKSVNGSVILSGKEGVFIDVKNIPIAEVPGPENPGSSRVPPPTGQFKVCVCMPQGKLFRIAVPTASSYRMSCSHVNLSAKHNPCI